MVKNGSIVGDIGGTKVHLALFDGDSCVKEQKFASRHFRSLEEIVEEFIDFRVSRACFAIAGPVQNQTCRLTNLQWEIKGEELKRFADEVVLINDLEAAALGLEKLKPDELICLNQGVSSSGNRAIVSAGTGLGVAALYWDGTAHRSFATEAGHVDFSPRDLQEKQLWDYLRKKYGHVSWERVVSGGGLEHLYWFMVEKKNVKERLEGEEMARLIVESSSPLCQEVVEWFASLYGSVVGNVALQYLALGGVYLAGGIAPHIIKQLERHFLKAFSNKGRFADLLLKIPVYVVMNESLPLLGALSRCNQKC